MIKVMKKNLKYLLLLSLLSFMACNGDEKIELGKQYVLYYDTTVEEPSVFASIYDDAGQLFPIETPEEWEMVEEVFQSFMAESEEGHECCGNHGNGCCHDNDEEHECCGNHGDCNCDN